MVGNFKALAYTVLGAVLTGLVGVFLPSIFKADEKIIVAERESIILDNILPNLSADNMQAMKEFIEKNFRFNPPIETLTPLRTASRFQIVSFDIFNLTDFRSGKIEIIGVRPLFFAYSTTSQSRGVMQYVDITKDNRAVIENIDPKSMIYGYIVFDERISVKEKLRIIHNDKIVKFREKNDVIDPFGLLAFSKQFPFINFLSYLCLAIVFIFLVALARFRYAKKIVERDPSKYKMIITDNDLEFYRRIIDSNKEALAPEKSVAGKRSNKT